MCRRAGAASAARAPLKRVADRSIHAEIETPTMAQKMNRVRAMRGLLGVAAARCIPRPIRGSAATPALTARTGGSPEADGIGRGAQGGDGTGRGGRGWEGHQPAHPAVHLQSAVVPAVRTVRAVLRADSSSCIERNGVRALLTPAAARRSSTRRWIRTRLLRRSRWTSGSGTRRGRSKGPKR